MSGFDEASVAEFLDQLCKAWETNDGAELGSLFTGDGSLINPFGQRAEGRSGVAAMYAEYFTGILAGTSTSVTGQAVRPIDDRHALVDVEQTILGADGAVVLAVHLTALLRCEDGQLRFVDARPYAFQDAPA
ncbi:MAG TPA: SgcJ/EcaC family oxidoreductase [Mycobacteriales bacterium]|nr:SgcJ/EcaC family oxidoreductase [Mycobacteriales bacterium]